MGKFSGREKLLLGTFFSAWIIYAIFASLYGSEASVMMNFFGLSSTEQGFLTTIQCIGGLGVALMCVFIGERMNKLRMIAIGIALLFAGSLATAFGVNYIQIILFALIAGIGYTFMDIMENASVVDIFPNRTKTVLPMLHMNYGIGAMIGPFFATAVVDPNTPSSFGRPFLFVAVASMVVFVFLLIASRRMGTQNRQPAAPKKETQNPGSIFKYPSAWVMIAAGVLYFSFQRGIMTWYPSYLYEDIRTTFAFSGLATTLFFVGSLACRIVSPALFNRFNILKMTILMTVLCAVCMVASIAVAPAFITLAVALAIAAGILQGAFVAAFVFLICDMFPGKSAAASGMVMIAINLGGITSPLWMGSMKDQLGGYTIPLYIVTLMLVGSAGLIALAHRMNRKKRDAAKPAGECSQTY